MVCWLGGMIQTSLHAPEVFAQSDQPQNPFENSVFEDLDPHDALQRHDTLALMGLGGILLGMLLFMGMHVYKQAYTSSQPSRKVFLRLEAERQRLLRELASLDDQYAQGKLPKQVYVPKRKRHKQQLVELTIRCKALSVSSRR